MLSFSPQDSLSSMALSDYQSAVPLVVAWVVILSLYVARHLPSKQSRSQVSDGP